MPRTNIAHTLGELEKLVQSVNPEDRAGVPAIGPAYEKLQRYVERIHELVTVRDFHEARKQEATREIQELLELSRKAATVVRVGLKEDIGNTNEALLRLASSHCVPSGAGRRRTRRRTTASRDLPREPRRSSLQPFGGSWRGGKAAFPPYFEWRRGGKAVFPRRHESRQGGKTPFPAYREAKRGGKVTFPPQRGSE